MSKYSGDPAYQAFRILQFVFVVAPIIAGLDKFCYLLTNWSQYISPWWMGMIHNHGRGFMIIVGIIEIIAGILVACKPKIFAYIVSLWLLLIIINLLMLGQFYDIALRDFGLMLSAFALGKLSKKFT